MAVILPRVEERPQYGFLSGLGTGLAHGLTQAAESKLVEFQRRRQAESGRESLRRVGIPESVIDLVQQLPPQQQLEYALAYHQGQQEEPQMQKFGLEALGGMGQRQRPQQGEQNQLQDILGVLGGAQQAKGLEQFLSPEQKRSLRMQQSFGTPQQEIEAEELPLAPAQQPPAQPGLAKAPAKGKETQVADFFKAVSKSRGQLKASDLNKMGATERKEAIREQEQANKETKKYYDDILSNDKAAHNNLLRLKKMEKLIDKGSLPYAAFYNLWETAVPAASKSLGKIPLVGGIAEAIGDAIQWTGKAVQRNITARDTEEYEKLTADFVRDAKAIFGARITDADLNAFMKTIPSLSLTDNGKKQIIKNMRLFNDAVEAEAKVMREIIKENNGKRPFNLREQVNERTKDILDGLAEEFTA